MDVPSGLDFSVSSDGPFLLFGLELGIPGPPPGFDPLWCSIGRKFSVADFLFLSALDFLLLPLAGLFVDLGRLPHQSVSEGEQAGRLPANPLSHLVDLRRVFKPWSFLSQLKSESISI